MDREHDYSIWLVSQQLSDWLSFNLAVSTADIAARSGRQEVVVSVLFAVFGVHALVESALFRWLAAHPIGGRPRIYGAYVFAEDVFKATKKTIIIIIVRLSMTLLQTRMGLQADPWGTAFFAYASILVCIVIARLFAPITEVFTSEQLQIARRAK